MLKEMALKGIREGFEVAYMGLDKSYIEAKIKRDEHIPVKVVDDLLELGKIDTEDYYVYCKLVEILNSKINIYNKLYK